MPFFIALKRSKLISTMNAMATQSFQMSRMVSEFLTITKLMKHTAKQHRRRPIAVKKTKYSSTKKFSKAARILCSDGVIVSNTPANCLCLQTVH